MFLVASGLIELVRHSDAGKAAVLQRAGPGMMLAEASAFSSTYHCDAIAAKASEVISVPRRSVVDLAANDPGFAVIWMAYLARQVQAARFRAEILTLKTVAKRLDAWLTFNDGQLPPRGRWLALAREIGVAHEALYRELARRRAQAPDFAACPAT